MPPLTEERRKELVKQAHDQAEHARTAVRLARREGNEKLKAMLKDKTIGEDDERRGLDEVQQLHDHYIGDIAKALEHKEKDILTGLSGRRAESQPMPSRSRSVAPSCTRRN